MESQTFAGGGCSRMHGNVELLAMIFIDNKMVLVPRRHAVSIDIQKYWNYTYLAI
jgi:hypothetical protein